MPFIRSRAVSLSGTSEEVNIFYQDIGRGKPVVLIHGWPLSNEMWEYQVNELPKHNIRIITYDRRGFGKSDKPWNGYDYDSLALDLRLLIEELDLTDVTLIGFSMGGGEVARFLSKHNFDGRVAKAAFISAVTPYLLQAEDNPKGLPMSQFEAFKEQMEEDRPAFLASFVKMFYGVTMFNHPVSEEIMRRDMLLALNATGYSTLKAMEAWSTTDFKNDLKDVTIPVLVVHGRQDVNVPISASSDELVKLIPHAQYLIYDDAPHGLFYTHKHQFNEDLIGFILAKESISL